MSRTGRDAGDIPLWRNRAFRLIWAGQTVSLFGDQVTALALPWLILLQTHSALAAGVVAAARYLPLVTLGLFAGVAADAIDRRALMIASDIGRALALGGIALLGIWEPSPPLWSLIIVVLALGSGQLLFQVAYDAWLPDVTGEAQLSQANAAFEATDAASVLAGFPLAGVLIAALGPTLALGADACSYIVSVLTLSRVRSAAPTSTVAQQGARRRFRVLLAEAGDGIHLMLTDPAQRLLLGVSTAIYLNVGSVTVLLATLTQLRLHLTAWQAGIVFGAMGVGGLIGSALAPRLYAWGWRRGLACVLVVAAFGCLGLAWASMLDPAAGFAVAIVADPLMDGSVALGFVLVLTATTLITPPGLRGRVNAARIIYAAFVRGLAALGGGALAGMGNPLSAFMLLALGFLLAALIAARARVEASVK